MASISVAQAAHKTLSGTTVDTVTFTGNAGNGWGTVVVTNRDTANAISVTFGISGGTAAAPTALGDDTYLVRAGEAKSFSPGPPITSVKVIGNGGSYSIEGV